MQNRAYEIRESYDGFFYIYNIQGYHPSQFLGSYVSRDEAQIELRKFIKKENERERNSRRCLAEACYYNIHGDETS